MDNVHHETERVIHWLEDPFQYEYLREGTYYVVGRYRGRIRKIPAAARLVGYAEVGRRAGRYNVYTRRFWFLKSYDRPLDPNGDYADQGSFPAEAVDPASVQCGQPSEAPVQKAQSTIDYMEDSI